MRFSKLLCQGSLHLIRFSYRNWLVLYVDDAQDVALSRDHTEFRLEDEEVRDVPDVAD